MIKRNNIKDSILEIKLKINKNINNMSYMLCNCSSLKYLPDLNGILIMLMIWVICFIIVVLYLSDISKCNTNNVKDMSYMFYNWGSLKYLPDIFKWNTNNVNNLSYLLYNCCSLKSLPDISKWNSKNLNNLSYLLYNCCSLKSLPDISKWNNNKI